MADLRSTHQHDHTDDRHQDERHFAKQLDRGDLEESEPDPLADINRRQKQQAADPGIGIHRALPEQRRQGDGRQQGDRDRIVGMLLAQIAGCRQEVDDQDRAADPGKPGDPTRNGARRRGREFAVGAAIDPARRQDQRAGRRNSESDSNRATVLLRRGGTLCTAHVSGRGTCAGQAAYR